MSDILKRMQHQRTVHDTQLSVYGKICKAVSKLSLGEKYDSDLFSTVMDLIWDYGEVKREYGFWDGAISAHVGWVKHKLEETEAKQAEEYAKAAADAGQMDLLDPDKPDHPHDIRCDGHGSG